MSDRPEPGGQLVVHCRCGTLRGSLRYESPSAGFRVVCYCDDCQAFAHYLGDEGPILDANGGTDILQLSPARLRIEQGAEQLACVRVTPKGPYRWYARCCRTPVGNTLATHRVPFLGLIHSCVDTGGRTRDEVLGPVTLRIMAKFATGTLPTRDAHQTFPLSHLLRIGSAILGWRLRGDHKRSPFFEVATGAPAAAVEYAPSRH